MLDHVDQAVLVALGPRLPRAVTKISADATVPGAWASGWGVVPASKSVWLPSGSMPSLARRPMLWRVLEVLLAHDGAASKEQLVRALGDA